MQLIVLMVMMMMMTMMTQVTAHSDFNNYPLGEITSVYYDNLGTMLVYKDQWKFVSYVSLAPMEEKERILEFLTSKINILCDNEKCSALPELRRVERKLKQLKADKQIFDDMIGRSNKREKRFTRGFSNSMGKMSKVLFGTLNSQDADYYDEQIDLVRNNSQQLSDLYRKHISITQLTMNTFSAAFEANAAKFREVDFNLEKLNKQISNHSANLREAQRDREVNSYLRECDEMMLEYESELRILTDAVLFGQRGLLHPRILTPELLFNNVNMHDLNNKKLPVTLGQYNTQSYNLIDISDVSIYYNNQQLVYIIEIPLLEKYDFTLYHAIPIPVEHSRDGIQGIYVFAKLPYNYLAVKSKDTYIPLSEHDISRCKKLDNMMICKQTNVLYRFADPNCCEAELWRKAAPEKIIRMCNVDTQKLRHTIWHPLHIANQWLYIAPQKETLNVFCNNHGGSLHYQTELSGVGEIHMSQNCTAKTKNVDLLTQSVYPLRSVNVDFISDVNLIANRSTEDIKKYNASTLELPSLNFSKISRLDADLLKTVNSSLNELYEEAEEIGRHHPPRVLHEENITWLYCVCLAIVSSVILCVGIKLSVNVFKECYVFLLGWVQHFSNYFLNCFFKRSRTNVNTCVQYVQMSDSSHVVTVIKD